MATDRRPLDLGNLCAKDIARFWPKVNKNGPVHPYEPSLGRCWIWVAAKDSDGYGMFQIGRRTARAHRLAFVLCGGDMSKGPMVLHSCDRFACCNDAHLQSGTAKDNTRDMLERGQYPRGERNGSKVGRITGARNPNVVLTPEKVTEIRSLVADGETYLGAGHRFGISPSTVAHLVHRRTWAYV